MSDVLARICADKREHVRRRKAERPAARLLAEVAAAPPPRDFAAALDAAAASRWMRQPSTGRTLFSLFIHKGSTPS